MSVFEFPLHFLRPWWWLLLLPLPLVLWMLARRGGGRAALARLADAALLPYLVHDTGVRKRFALGLVALAWLLAAAALSGPAWQKAPAPLYVNGAARVVVLSLSDRMLAQDMQPDRLVRARFAVRDLLDGAGDARMALVAYAGAAFTVAPLTDDKHTILNLLQALKPNVMPVPGNDAAAGIAQGAALLRHAHAKGGEIVLVTDSADDAAVAQARDARAHGVRVDVLGIGTPEGAPVPQGGGGFASAGTSGMVMARRDDAALRAVADAGGGRYAVLQANGAGTQAFVAPTAEAGHAGRGERAQLWRDGGIWLLPALLILGALAFRRGWLLVLAILVLPIGMPVARAATWDSLWANRDQRALQALRHDDPVQAQKLATTPGMRGAAEYRAGDYAVAAKAFAQGDDARSRYNLGNALAEQGEYGKAIAAYKEALRLDPEMADARANLDSVQDWLKRHAPPPRQRHGKNRQGQRQGQSKSGSGQSQGQSRPPGSSSGSQAGDAAPSPQPPSSSGSGTSSHPDSGPGEKSQAQDGNDASGQDGNGPSASAAARQQRDAAQAAQALEREMQQARGSARSGQRGKAGTFALGQGDIDRDSRLDAQQRALLHAVPDDPGALLRRKFKLEWEQRNGQQQEDGQQ